MVSPHPHTQKIIIWGDEDASECQGGNYILQYINVSNQIIVDLKLTQCCMLIISQ